jgi:hypothetical protein
MSRNTPREGNARCANPALGLGPAHGRGPESVEGDKLGCACYRTNVLILYHTFQAVSMLGIWDIRRWRSWVRAVFGFVQTGLGQKEQATDMNDDA